jgi:anti-sigma factor RsiW
MTERSFSDEELGAYLDGELSDDRRAAVAAFLAAHPEQARRLEAYRADGQAIARLFASAGQSSEPPQIPLPVSTRARLGGWHRAAAIGLFLAGALATFIWSVVPSGKPGDLQRFGEFAAAAYPTRPASLNVSLTEVSQLISKPLPSPVTFRAPTGSGYELVASRAIEAGGAVQMQLVFSDANGTLVTMFLSPRPGAADTPFMAVPNGTAHPTLVWIDDQIACAVSGALPPDQLEAAARLIYRHLVS